VVNRNEIQRAQQRLFASRRALVRWENLQWDYPDRSKDWKLNWDALKLVEADAKAKLTRLTISMDIRHGISGEEAAALLCRVRKAAGFAAFVDLIHGWIGSGQSERAFLLLVKIRTSEELAYRIIERWPLSEDEYLLGHSVLQVLPEEERALRLAVLLEDLGTYDWPWIIYSA